MIYFSHIMRQRSAVLKFLSIVFFLIAASGISVMDKWVYGAEDVFFSIHLLSYKDIEEAKAKVKEFNDLGYNAFYRQETVNGDGNIYNIYIERFASRTEAELEAGILRELDLISDYDIHEIIEKTEGDLKNNKQDIKGYYLKVCSLKEKENAEKMVKMLQDYGYHAFYNYESVQGKGDWYRVYIDEYKSEGDAIRDAKELMASGIITDYEIKGSTSGIQQSEIRQKDGEKIYSLHTGSFKESINAGKEVDRLKESGLKAFLVKTEILGEQWSRVYVGEFQDEKAAREKGAELLEKGVISYFKPILIDKAGE